MEACPERSSGDALLIAATAASIAIAKGKTADELAILAAFFTVLGDSLALLATESPGTN
jgi:hypothetical protein